jgi:zinc transporter ZupT
MSLLTETLIISACMILLSGLPLFSRRLREHSRFFFLLGTGALSGILLFDLIPDLFEMGGSQSLWGVGAVWALYSILHLTHLKHHKDPDAPEALVHHHHGPSSFFLVSMVGHCLASGILLVASEGLAGGLNRTVFLALLSHKAYEALTVSSILIEREGSRAKAAVSIAIYSISLPVGVALTYYFRSVLTPSIAMIATSLAAGTLLGCLIYDFILPSLVYLKARRRDAAWILIGLILTQFMMRGL